MDLLSVLVREESDAFVFRFVNLTHTEYGRLSEAVARLAAEPS